MRTKTGKKAVAQQAPATLAILKERLGIALGQPRFTNDPAANADLIAMLAGVVESFKYQVVKPACLYEPYVFDITVRDPDGLEHRIAMVWVPSGGVNEIDPTLIGTVYKVPKT